MYIERGLTQRIYFPFSNFHFGIILNSEKSGKNNTQNNLHLDSRIVNILCNCFTIFSLLSTNTHIHYYFLFLLDLLHFHIHLQSVYQILWVAYWDYDLEGIGSIDQLMENWLPNVETFIFSTWYISPFVFFVSSFVVFNVKILHVLILFIYIECFFPLKGSLVFMLFANVCCYYIEKN